MNSIVSNPRDIRICFIGDSFVNGTGDEEKLGWTGRLCTQSHSDEQDITYYNLGIRRNTPSDIKQRWQQECALRLPEESENIVVFSFGVNDTVFENGHQRVSTTDSICNTQEILQEALKHYRVLMIGPPPIDDAEQNLRIQQLDQEFFNLCKQLTVPYLSVFEDLVAEPLWLNEVMSNDGAHPRSKGYSYLAKLISNWSEWKL